MNTVTKTALANLRQNKSRNILIGIAICLTTLLLFLVPGVGLSFVTAQTAAVKEVYPTYHGVYRQVDEAGVSGLRAAQEIEEMGLRGDVGEMVNEDYTISMMYVDGVTLRLSRGEITSGRLPEAENEILVSKGLLHAMGISAEVGDTITIPYQSMEEGGLSLQKEKEFVISGMTPDSEANEENKMYTAYVSQAFFEEEIPKSERLYRVYFRLNVDENGSSTYLGTTTDDIEAEMKEVGARFGIPEDNIGENSEYLGALYVDPAVLPAIGLIMAIVVAAGIVTIYSIYYISMIHRVQEYGKLRALGATKRQLRGMILREGFCVALLAIPAGLLLGTVFLVTGLPKIFEIVNQSSEEILVAAIAELTRRGEIPLLNPWLYLLAALVTFVTVYLSLLKPMKVASKVSPIEALRFHGEDKNQRHQRAGYGSVSLLRLTSANLARNKRRTVMTILAMALTGSFFLTVAVALACMNPKEAANSVIEGQYVIGVKTEEGNKEHPELAWNQVQQDNPITPEVLKQIEALDGVEKTEVFSRLLMGSSSFEGEDTRYGLKGYPESYRETLEKGIQEGNVKYDELAEKNQVILADYVLEWEPNLKLGDTIAISYMDGDVEKEAKLEIAAIGDYPSGMGNPFMTSQALMEKLSENQLQAEISIFADQKYDKELEAQLQNLCQQSGKLELDDTWQEEYEEWKMVSALTSALCYSFLGVLGVICIMNLVNTMLNSIHVRRKELGMLQAIGMSESQLVTMLNLEGIFYTAGTLLLSLSLGSLGGYAFYLYASEHNLMGIEFFHYPWAAAAGLILALLLLQLFLGTVIGKSLKKQSLIEQIRFSE